MSEVSIDILNDYCLLQILELLPLQNRVKVELVCKRWQRLCRQLWKSTQTLVIGNCGVHGYYSFLSSYRKILLEPLLKLRGANIKFLTIGYDYSDCSNNYELELIAKYCDSLESLTLKNCDLTTDAGVENFCIKHHSLTEIKLYHVNITDKQLECFFISQPKLKCLELEHMDTLDKPNFDKLNEDVESILISCCENFINYSIIRNLNKYKHLKKIYFLTNESLRINELVRAIPQIEHLTIKCCNIYNNEELCEIRVLKNLRSLTLDLAGSISDYTMAAIVENCRLLECIHFGYRGNDCPVTNKGLKILSKLPELSEIYMSGMKQVNDEILEMLSKNEKLTHLDVSNCDNIRDKGVIAVLERCPHLQQLDIKYCEYLSRTTLNRAIMVAKARPITPPLRINIGLYNTNINTYGCIYENTCLKILGP